MEEGCRGFTPSSTWLACSLLVMLFSLTFQTFSTSRYVLHEKGSMVQYWGMWLACTLAGFYSVDSFVSRQWRGVCLHSGQTPHWFKMCCKTFSVVAQRCANIFCFQFSPSPKKYGSMACQVSTMLPTMSPSFGKREQTLPVLWMWIRVSTMLSFFVIHGMHEMSALLPRNDFLM